MRSNFRVACSAALYWRIRGLNQLADGGSDEDFKDITIRINGGLNGLAERQRYYEVAKKALVQKSEVSE